ncbi:MAG: NfeD family protein [Deltaproteobacteria bacterium]|nr:NfeD family protein [Deltaproteobacteria bacterium]
MDPHALAVSWAVAGVAMMASELVVPGLIVVFPGAGALIVALLVWLGVLHGVMPCLLAWVVLSAVLLFGLRGWLMRKFPSEKAYAPHNPDAEAYGTVVDVVEAIPADGAGRIRHEGTTWSATSRSGAIPAGARARLLFRENVAWVVEAIPPAEAPPASSSKT